MNFWIGYILIIGFLNCINSYEDPWIWICVRNRGVCQRTLKINVSQEDNLFTSIEICKLVCGTFGSLWPRPTIATKLRKKLVQLHPRNINFSNPKLPEETSSLLKDMQNVFLRKPNLKCSKCAYTENALKIQLNFHDTNTTLLSKTDESYKLNVITITPQIYVNISAVNVFGVRNALETLSQIIAVDTTLNENEPTMHMVSNVFIEDKPKFHHRGLLIDTARHYLKLGTIKRQIDAMGMSKMNVLHWHVTDTHSFPLVLPNVPHLAQYGAYSQKKIYTLKDVQDIMHYGKIRGVRIILEIDTPSHSGNGWQFGSLHGLGDLGVCFNSSPYQRYCLQPPCGQVNPANKNLYRILENVYRDVGSVYPDGEFFHMGGDEISMACWNRSNEILAYMRNANMTGDKAGFLALWDKYQRKALDAYDKSMSNANWKVIVWSSALANFKTAEKFLDKNRYIIQTWVPHSSSLPKYLLQRGYQIIMSPKTAWYLDHGVRSNTRYSSWRRVFANRLPKHKNVLGGEVCMWGEFADDVNIDMKIWPRAAAFAERLWTNPKRAHSKQVENRFYQHRERLVANKIGAEPVVPEWYIIQTWVPHSSSLPKYLLQRGYQIIMSPKNAWYLDHGVRSNTRYSSWRRVFGNRLPKHKNVLGGEVCMWGEFADDVNIDMKIWPRAAAFAERLWTNPKRAHSKQVENRFYQHRERLVANKIGAEPVVPEWCVYNEGLC